VSVYLETPVALKAGSQYKMAIQSDGATLSNAIYWFRGGNLYEGGDSSIGSGVDFGFYTYMTPGAVLDDPSPLGAIPDPSTYALIFGIGAMGLIGWRRIRR